MSDRSAAALARLALADDLASATEALTEVLRHDPPLALWAVCRAKQDGARPRDAKSLAAWLVPRVVHVLNEPGATGVPPVPIEQQPTEYVHHVEQAVARAELAAALAAEDAAARPEEVYLAGLLAEPSVWPRIAEEDLPKDAPLPAADWLGQQPAPATARWVSEAIALLAEEPADDARREQVARSRRLGAAAADWIESIPDVSVPLAELIVRLGRLATLETRFRDALEAEKLEAMAEFAAGAGHEINNPLAVIAGRAQLLLQEEANPERRRALALMNTQAKRVYEMIADMMLFARPPAPHFEQVELVALVDRIVEDLGPRTAEQAVSLHRTGGDGPSSIVIDADPAQLNVAIRAMCRNALEAIGHDGRIEIELGQTHQQATVRVRDDGPGIQDDARRHLFDPYYSQRQAGRGLGLGLCKCWRIVVTNHGGRIDVESRPGQQTVFTITLPKRQ